MGVFQMEGASFLSGGCGPWCGIGFDGEGREGTFEKNRRMGGRPLIPPLPSLPPATMGNPAHRSSNSQQFHSNQAITAH